MQENPFTIVYADDEADVRDTVADMLRAAGVRVCACKDGSEAIRACGEIKPDALLLDLNMPGMDGFAVAREIRSNPATARLRVVALTGRSTWDMRIKALDAGFDEFMVKPIGTAHLVAVLRGKSA
ncbi:MAG TPA: response regulator [Rhodanobacteraceae bacterium]|jgi:DNA-binding response OmpR family regulator